MLRVPFITLQVNQPQKGTRSIPYRATGLPGQIQLQQALQNSRIGHIRRIVVPAIGRGDGFIQGLMGIHQPDRLSIV
jgi:hypothetical protein